MPDYKKATDAADMKANFPPKPSPVIGRPNLQELVRLLHYIIQCAQTHQSTISPAMNLLYVAVPPEVYEQYTQEPYPAASYPYPAEVPPVPDYAMAQDDNDRARITAQHAADLKTRQDVINMNNALTDTFLSLFEPTYRASYERQRTRAPNAVFRNVFQHFLTTYGRTTADERWANKERMAADWTPSDGFESLIDRINQGIQYAFFAFHPIQDHEIVDIAERVLTRCGLYPEEMKRWIARDGTDGDEDQDKTWFRFQEVWTTAINAADDATSTAAGQHGYGMNISGTTDDESFDTSVTNFSQAHQHTQAAINSLTQQNQALQSQHSAQMNQMQQQMNAIQQQLAMAANAQMMMPTMMQMPAYNNNNRNNNRSNNNNNRNNNNYNQGNNYNNNNYQGNNNYGSQRQPQNPVKRFENLN